VLIPRTHLDVSVICVSSLKESVDESHKTEVGKKKMQKWRLKNRREKRRKKDDGENQKE